MQYQISHSLIHIFQHIFFLENIHMTLLNYVIVINLIGLMKFDL